MIIDYFTMSNLFCHQNKLIYYVRSCGLMDKALGFEPRDCGFESRHDLNQFFFFLDLYTYFKVAVNFQHSFYEYRTFFSSVCI